MKTANESFHSTKISPIELSAKELQAKRYQSQNDKKKKTLQLQTSKPPRNSVKIQPLKIRTHFTWALILTILCFFVIGPCWALYKTFELRRMIERHEFDVAICLSNKISSVLVISTIFGVFIWAAFFFCSAGLLLTGILLKKHFIS